MPDNQQVVYDILVMLFHAYSINPKDAIPAMRKLADDAERICLKSSTAHMVSGPALVQ